MAGTGRRHWLGNVPVRILPMTHVREQRRSIAGDLHGPRVLARAVSEWDDVGRERTSTVGLSVSRVALDRSGVPVAGSETVTQIGVDPHVRWERAGAGTRLSALRHPFLRSEVQVWHWPAQDVERTPGHQPATISGTTADEAYERMIPRTGPCIPGRGAGKWGPDAS